MRRRLHFLCRKPCKNRWNVIKYSHILEKGEYMMNEHEKNEMQAEAVNLSDPVAAPATTEAPEMAQETEATETPEATAEADTPEAGLAAMQARNRRMKKRILMVMGGVLLGLALLIGGLLLVEHLMAKKAAQIPEFDYDFYDAESQHIISCYFICFIYTNYWIKVKI
jgi:hypothetical protein